MGYENSVMKREKKKTLRFAPGSVPSSSVRLCEESIVSLNGSDRCEIFLLFYFLLPFNSSTVHIDFFGVTSSCPVLIRSSFEKSKIVLINERFGKVRERVRLLNKDLKSNRKNSIFPFNREKKVWGDG